MIRFPLIGPGRLAGIASMIAVGLIIGAAGAQADTASAVVPIIHFAPPDGLTRITEEHSAFHQDLGFLGLEEYDSKRWIRSLVRKTANGYTFTETPIAVQVVAPAPVKHALDAAFSSTITYSTDLSGRVTSIPAVDVAARQFKPVTSGKLDPRVQTLGDPRALARLLRAVVDADSAIYGHAAMPGETWRFEGPAPVGLGLVVPAEDAAEVIEVIDRGGIKLAHVRIVCRPDAAQLETLLQDQVAGELGEAAAAATLSSADASVTRDLFVDPTTGLVDEETDDRVMTYRLAIVGQGAVPATVHETTTIRLTDVPPPASAVLPHPAGKPAEAAHAAPNTTHAAPAKTHASAHARKRAGRR